MGEVGVGERLTMKLLGQIEIFYILTVVFVTGLMCLSKCVKLYS